jgi:hypothetical protein
MDFRAVAFFRAIDVTARDEFETHVHIAAPSRNMRAVFACA